MSFDGLSEVPRSRFGAAFLTAMTLGLAACGGGDVSEDLRREPLAATVSTTAAPAYDPDDLYRFFAIAFGAAPGVTYMGQLLDAANAGMSIKAIVNVFTTKSQFLENYPASLTNQAFAQKLVDNVVGNSASIAAKAEAVRDIEAALKLPDWTRGDITYAIFNNLARKPADDPKWAGTAQKMANQVAYAKHFTETMKVDTTDLGTLRSVVSGVTQLSPSSADLGQTIQRASGAVPERLAPASAYTMAYAGGLCNSYALCLVGIDHRVVTARFGVRGELTAYTSVRDPELEALSVGTAVVGELGGNADLTWGRWNGGTPAGKFYDMNFASPYYPLLTFNGFHYVVGRNTSVMPNTGRATYSAIAATGPSMTNTYVALQLGSVDLAASKVAVDYATGKVGFDFKFTYLKLGTASSDRTFQVSSTGGIADLASSSHKFQTEATGVKLAISSAASPIQMMVNGLDYTASAASNTFVRLVPFGEGALYLALVFHDWSRNAGVIIFKRDGAP